MKRGVFCRQCHREQRLTTRYVTINGLLMSDLRRGKKLRAVDICRQCDWSPSYYSRLESREDVIISRSTLNKLVLVFGEEIKTCLIGTTKV